jgi:hypothetical protein
MSGYHSDADIPFGMFYGRIGRGVAGGDRNRPTSESSVWISVRR